MNNQTIYSYKLLHRFRWSYPGYVLQVVVLAAALSCASYGIQLPFDKLVTSLSILVLLPAVHFFLFRLYTYAISQRTSITADTLFSPWWGAGTSLPLTLSVFRRAETTVILGSLLFSFALFVWLPLPYGLALIAGAIALILPRLLSLLASLRHPKHSRVKYELRSVAFLLTDGKQ